MNNHCKNELNLEKLCFKCASGKKAKVCELKADKICASDKVKAMQVWSNSVNTNSLCALNATLTNACISNLQIGNFIPSIRYRATINFSATATYALGGFVNFNNIVDDPNGNVSLVLNTSYTAPASGYYALTYKINITNLNATNGPVLGTPVGSLEIYVNGILVRDAYSPYLSFFSDQKAVFSSLITLQAGDIVTMKYNILGGNGVPVTGTVDIVGAGIEDGNSLFKIIFMSSLSSGTQPACNPCPPVMIDCEVICPESPTEMCESCQ
jgi:hypothetical protein